MTRRQRRQHKLGNAIRARIGSWWRVPQPMAWRRVRRWLERGQAAGDLHGQAIWVRFVSRNWALPPVESRINRA